MTVRELLAATASHAPAPGGGGIAAMTAAAAAALLEMVANLTIGKKGYEEAAADMQHIKLQCERTREYCLTAIDADAAAFRSVIAALRLSKDMPGRTEKVQKAFKEAARVPFELGTQIFIILKLSQDVIRKGNSWALTDAAISVLQARSAMRSAFYSVKVNLASITDQQFIEMMEQAMLELDKRAEGIEQEVLSFYKHR
jgi:methenyltetrahydrofolate cyclohydrolase